MSKLKLKELSGTYAIARLAADAPIPATVDGADFFSMTRTREELSVICKTGLTASDVKSDGPWTCFQLLGPFDLSLTGIGLRIIGPVSDAGIGFLFVTTFDTDYLLVKTAAKSNAVAALQKDGIEVISE